MSSKIIEIIVAFEPADEVVFRWKEWLKKNVDPLVDLKVIVNPGVIAGAEITYEGKYVDLTAKKKVEEMLNDRV